MMLSMTEFKVLNMLPRGAGYPLSTANICKATGLKERDVREAISILIGQHGVPIVANRSGHNTGMFIATDEAELNIGVTLFKNQVTTMNARIRAIEQADLTGWEQALRSDIKRLETQARHHKEAN
ncbi:DNA replication protein [Lactiplantibacillus plantarum]|nr:DNA replication protein [Lactiplantibacillus plantarum]MBS0945551.1 DNA replication protein [Lactiplantibacillus plantarum]